MASRHQVKIHNDEEPETDAKLHRSVFMLTINTNRTPTPELHKSFSSNVNKLLAHIPRFIDTNEGYDPDDEMIINIHRGHFETGENRGRLHVHVVVEILHNSNIRMNGGKLTRAGELMGCKILNRVIRGHDPLQKALDYARKNV